MAGRRQHHIDVGPPRSKRRAKCGEKHHQKVAEAYSTTGVKRNDCSVTLKPRPRVARSQMLEKSAWPAALPPAASLAREAEMSGELGKMKPAEAAAEAARRALKAKAIVNGQRQEMSK